MFGGAGGGVGARMCSEHEWNENTCEGLRPRCPTSGAVVYTLASSPPLHSRSRGTWVKADSLWKCVWGGSPCGLEEGSTEGFTELWGMWGIRPVVV